MLVHVRTIALAAACALAAPSIGLADALACSSEAHCCCDAHDEVASPADSSAISGRCCCDLERPEPQVRQAVAAVVTSAPTSPVLAPTALVTVIPTDSAVVVRTLPEARGPPPSSTLLAQRTALLL